MNLSRPVCHELGNLLAGVQLSGHFLAGPLEDRDRRQLAHEIQLLCAQAGAWVALLRPLGKRKLALGRVEPSELLAALRRHVDELLWRPEQLKAIQGKRLPDVQVDVDAVHQLLTLLVTCALAEGGPELRIRLEAREHARHLVLVLTDSGSSLVPAAAQTAVRGRELVLQVGDKILRAGGGRLEIVPRKKGNRVALYLPRAPRR